MANASWEKKGFERKKKRFRALSGGKLRRKARKPLNRKNGWANFAPKIATRYGRVIKADSKEKGLPPKGRELCLSEELVRNSQL